MSLTYSNKLLLGIKAYNFKIINVITEKNIDLYKYVTQYPFVLCFICNHCPYVIHIIDKIIKLGNVYNNILKFILISSNDVSQYPQDSPDNMKNMAIHKNIYFPYCYDETQEVAKNYKVTCTPDFYLFNENKNLVYHGQFDDSRPYNNITITGNSLEFAIKCCLRNKNIIPLQYQSCGCSIKWKK